MSHPITPPLDLVAAWCREADDSEPMFPQVAAKAAQWGADEELEACCAELESIPSPLGIPFGKMASNALRAVRRPKPPSLKKQALAALNEIEDRYAGPSTEEILIRRALEQLDD